VAAEVDRRHREARRLAQGVADRALDALGSLVSTSGTLRYNPSPFERDGVPGLGWRVDDDEPRTDRTRPVEVEVRGEIARAPGLEFRVLDEPDLGDLYNFCPAPGAVPGALELHAKGDHVLARSDRCTVRLRLHRRPDELFVRIDGVIRNERPDHRLRLVVGLPAEPERVLAGAPFELVERALVSEGSAFEPPSPTWPACGVVLASGIAVLAEGVLEYEVAGDALLVTLLRSVGVLSRPGMATRAGRAGPSTPTPGAQMTGETRFRLAVLPEADRDHLLPSWERFALPLLAARGRGGGTLPREGALLEVAGAALSGVRRGRDAVEVRVWNPSREPGAASIHGRRLPLSPAEIATVPIGAL
jgi:hypothetical protein